MKLPSLATTIFAAVAGVLSVLNTTVFQPGPPWQTGINIALLALASFGIAPLLGSAFRSALDLTIGETTAITSVLAFAQLLQQTASISTGDHAVIQGILVVAAGLGFGTNTLGAVATQRGTRSRGPVAGR